MIELAIHTDNWRVLSGSYKLAVESAVKYGVSHIELGLVHGQYFMNGLGFDPAVSMQSNPRALRRYLDGHGIRISQIDAAYPMMGPEGSTFGVQYVQQAIRFGGELGAPLIDTTDGPTKIEGYSDEEVFRITCENYRQLLPWAEDYKVVINVEPHGPYTSNGDFMERLLRHFESEHLRFNFDTGNTYIAGLDPLEYLKRFRKYLTNSHIKDVSASLAAAARGEQTGIAASEVAVGEGVNAQNIAKCIAYLRETNWSGVVCIECSGTDEKTKKSLDFLRGLLK